jgi:superoxide dismutase, Fe-Mn family
MIKLCPLPYAETALAPYISAETLQYHHGKHHKSYVKKANTLIKDTPLDGKTLEEIIIAARDESDIELYNQAAQVWNHGFFWSSLSPEASKPSKHLDAAIKSVFGSIADFKAALKKEATDHFGSGWVWVVAEGGAIFIEATHDAQTLACAPTIPLLVIDVWEHAYYLDHQNERKTYVEAVVDNLLNWEFASANFDSKQAWRYPE